MMPSTSSALHEALIAGRYERLGVIAESATSSIFRAIDHDGGHDVVLKCFEANKHSAFLREMAVGFDVEHPQVMRCLDAFHLTANEGCVVYEFMQRGTLKSWMDSQAERSTRDVMAVLEDLLGALSYLHEKGRIHCDIKPENIFLKDSADDRLQPVLGDLGAACFLREAQSGRHTIGTPAYMAPERSFNSFYFNSDLYSLGILAYEMATGERPFHGSAKEIARAHLSQRADFERIEDPALADFIEGLLEKEPANRIGSARTARRILDNLHGRPVGRPHVTSTTLTSALSKRQAPVAQLGNALNSTPGHIQLQRQPAALQVFQVSGEALVAATFEEHVEILAPNTTAPVRVLVNARALAPISSGLCLYLTPPRILAMNVLTGERLALLDDCNDARSFSVRGQRLVWHGERGGQYRDLVRRVATSFPSRGYLMHAQGCVLGADRFARTDGAYNKEVVLCTSHGDEIERWQLDGPVVVLTTLGDELLVLTLATGDVQVYTLWRLEPGTRAARIALPAQVNQWCSTPGHVFWSLHDGELFGSGCDLQPLSLGRLPAAATHISVSPDHDMVGAAYQPAPQHAGTSHQVQVWQAA